MAESTTKAACTDAEWQAAAEAGLPYETPGTNAFDAALHTYTERMQRIAYADGRKDEAAERAWQPIETAPEDELILVATTGDYVDTAHWTEREEKKQWWWSAGVQQLHPNLIPTHWMPLPKHPA